MIPAWLDVSTRLCEQYRSRFQSRLNQAADAGNSYTWHKETAKAAIFNSVGGTATIAASEFTD